MHKSPIKKVLLVSLSSIVIANTVHASPKIKPTGLSLEWYQQSLDLDVTKVDASIPGVPASTLEAAKQQLSTHNTVKVLNLKLDYQLHPYLNVFAAIGQVSNVTQVDFSKLNYGLSNFVQDNSGQTYTVGATAVGQYGAWRPALHYAYSHLKLNGQDDDVVVHAVVPSIGRQTPYGEISASFLYQDIDATYSGTINATAPVVGEVSVPVHITTKNSNELHVMAGWQRKIGNDLYLKTSIGLNQHKQFQLQLNQRF